MTSGINSSYPRSSTSYCFAKEFEGKNLTLAGSEHPLQKRVNALAKRMEIEKPVKVYINDQKIYEAATPTEHENAINIDSKADDDEVSQFLICHELAHIKLNHHAQLSEAENKIKAEDKFSTSAGSSKKIEDASEGESVSKNKVDSSKQMTTIIKTAAIAMGILGLALIFASPVVGMTMIMVAMTAYTVNEIMNDKEIFPKPASSSTADSKQSLSLSEKNTLEEERKLEKEADLHAFKLLETDTQREAAVKYFASKKDNTSDKRRHPLNSERVQYLQDDLDAIRKKRQETAVKRPGDARSAVK
jgi:Zn-dependent peptidase ImmA (M78 family)